MFAVLLYCAGIVGAAGGYARLALTTSGITRDDVVVVWGLLDKRQPVFAYLVVVAFVLFHRAMVSLFFAPTYGWTRGARRRAGRWLARVAGAVVVAVVGRMAGWAPRPCATSSPRMRRRSGGFTSITRWCTSAALEQIRLGATPYVEAQTQYGLGNQLLAHALTKAFGFSNHGFYAGVLLVDVVCIVVFFVIVQQILGLGWALAGLRGLGVVAQPRRRHRPRRLGRPGRAGSPCRSSRLLLARLAAGRDGPRAGLVDRARCPPALIWEKKKKKAPAAS